MPRRSDLNSVLVIGSGPIVIGQGCEFDYSGTQACRVLKAEGIRVSLVNSNPATIMTDPEFADATYVEPITLDVLEKVIAKERPDAVLPTLGGQTALNAAVELHEAGVLARYGTELIGARIEAIKAGEDRERFKEIVTSLPPLGGAAGEPGDVPQVPDSRICHSLEGVFAAAGQLGYPVVVRPSYTLGGSGSGIARSKEELRRIAGAGLDASPTTEVLLEESILGWKEFELELMRDRNDNVVVVCSIENIDPMGVHTGDSVTVAPAMTLTDREYQRMRDTAIAIVRAVGVDTGGCNIQFAVNPTDGRMVVIEMNPRVSRSSALASKATGFPIAKIAAKLAIGYSLDEIPNDITGQTPACFEPALDYVVVKTPRFAFEKFPSADTELTTHMKSVGEAMAIGRSFPEALQKALRSMESRGASFSWAEPPGDTAELLRRCAVPHDGRLATVHEALRSGATVADVAEASSIDPWFVDQIAHIEEIARHIRGDAGNGGATAGAGAGYGEALVTGPANRASGPVSGRCDGDVPPRGREAQRGVPGGSPPQASTAQRGVPGGRPPGPAQGRPRASTSFGRGDAPAGQGRRVRRRADRPAARDDRGRRPGDPLGPRRPARVPRGGHLRRRVRRPYPLPVLQLRRRDRGAARRPAQGDHPGQRAEPDRPGH